jgi:hypothetical protein
MCIYRYECPPIPFARRPRHTCPTFFSTCAAGDKCPPFTRYTSIVTLIVVSCLRMATALPATADGRPAICKNWNITDSRTCQLLDGCMGKGGSSSYRCEKFSQCIQSQTSLRNLGAVETCVACLPAQGNENRTIGANCNSLIRGTPTPVSTPPDLTPTPHRAT